MKYFRPSEERGQANFGWLQSRHSFSFGSYYDPRHMGISVLRVINDDSVAPGAGFSTHGHQDMEIISYILEGSIEHKDSLGNVQVIPAGEIQRMTAGTGVTHSEYNASLSDNLKFLQIWILPDRRGLPPSYEQMPVIQQGTVTPLVTPNGISGSLSIHQNASIYRVAMEENSRIELNSGSRTGYLHVINGHGKLDDVAMAEGDGIGVASEPCVITTGADSLTALWFDLPPVAGLPV